MIKTDNDKSLNKPTKYGWTFDCPTYDNRSSNSINAGWHHGVGKTQPVGTTSHNNKSAIPFGRKHGQKVDQLG